MLNVIKVVWLATQFCRDFTKNVENGDLEQMISKSKMVFQILVLKLVYGICETLYGKLVAYKTENTEGV